jgi:hypothetical protein
MNSIDISKEKIEHFPADGLWQFDVKSMKQI